MQFVFLFFCVVVCFDCHHVPKEPQDRRDDKTRLRLGTFNAFWLFDGVDDAQSPWSSRDEADRHIQRVAEFVSSKFDVVVLQEVENCEVLQKLVRHLEGDKFVPYLIPGMDTSTGQNTALLTKIDPISLRRSESRMPFPVAGSTCFSRARGRTGVSKHGVARFRASSFTFDLIFAHFKVDFCLRRLKCV